jgi:hypothetical protein
MTQRLFPAGAIGAVIGLAIGYTVEKLSHDHVGDFWDWINPPNLFFGEGRDPIFWLVGGITVASATVILLHPIHK